MIRYFGSRKKLFKIHFRNVSAPLPHFTETMIDDGYYDMSKIMRALVESSSKESRSPITFRFRQRPEGGRHRSARRRWRRLPAQPCPGILTRCMNSMLVAAQSSKADPGRAACLLSGSLKAFYLRHKFRVMPRLSRMELKLENAVPFANACRRGLRD